MTITLEKASINDAQVLHALQIKCFRPLLDKYNDHDTNPSCEPLDKTLSRINDPLKGIYKILRDHVLVGGIVIKYTNPETLFLGPIFIDPAFQNQKIAQKALKLIEDLFPEIHFIELASIVKEKRSIHLYEKMGYLATDKRLKISNSMILSFFRKKMR